jgi:hypothetical protein
VNPKVRSKRELVEVEEQRNQVTRPDHERRLGLAKPYVLELPRDSPNDPASDVAFDALVLSVLTEANLRRACLEAVS